MPEASAQEQPGGGGGNSLAPVTCRQLFLGFSSVGISGFGGVLPFARRMLVEERRWLTAEEFNSLLGLCQFLPGPNVANLSIAVGSRYQGIRGAIAAVSGLFGGPLLIVLLLGLLYDRYGQLPQVQGLLRGVAAVGCGLLFGTALRMGLALQVKRLFLPFTLAVFVAVALLRWPMPIVMVALLALAAGVAYAHLKRKGAP